MLPAAHPQRHPAIADLSNVILRASVGVALRRAPAFSQSALRSCFTVRGQARHYAETRAEKCRARTALRLDHLMKHRFAWFAFASYRTIVTLSVSDLLLRITLLQNLCAWFLFRIPFPVFP